MSELNAKVKELWNEGKTSTEIAEVLQITRSAVMGRVHRLRAKGELDFRVLPTPKQAGQKPVTLSEPRKPVMPKSMKGYEGPLIKRKYYPAVEKKERAETPPSPDAFRYVALLDLEEQHCRYIMGQDSHRGAYYCGEPKALHSYCTFHAKLCYRKPSADEYKAKPVRKNLTRFAS